MRKARARARKRGRRGGEGEGKGREGSVPELCHHRSRSQTDQDETRPLTMHKKPQKSANDVEKSETASGALTDMLIPDPLFPALAIRRRYLLLCQACDVERAQTIKRDRHSERKKKKPVRYICTPALVRRETGSKDMRTSKRPSRRGSLAAQPDISHNARRGLLC